MEQLQHLLGTLSDRHRTALEWFVSHAGTVQPWPRGLPDGTLLATKAKGIYKPQWMEYTLSIRQTLHGKYPDREPLFRADGTWQFQYFQENDDPVARDSEYTNRGLMKCMKANIPVGVMRQVSGKPHVTYNIVGVALVSKWENGYFYLEGFNPSGVARDQSEADGHGYEAALAHAQRVAEELGASAFDPISIEDARKKAFQAIVQRQGRPQFRKSLMQAYGSKCAVTGCDVEVALEAAHITPYMGPDTNLPTNGLLLRADIHTLFDLGYIAVDTSSMSIRIRSELVGTVYDHLAGRSITFPADLAVQPSSKALDDHRQRAGL